VPIEKNKIKVNIKMSFKVIKIEDLDVSKITMSLPRKAPSKDARCKFFNFNYDNKPILIQFPREKALFGAVNYQGGENYSTSLDLKEYPEITKKLVAIDDLCEKFVLDNLKEFYKKTGKDAEAIARLNHKKIVKYKKDKETELEDLSEPFMSYKINFGSKYWLDVGDGPEEVTLDADNVKDVITTKSEILPIINVYGWVASGNNGLTCKIQQAKVWSLASGGAVAFIDENEELPETSDKIDIQVQEDDSESESVLVEEQEVTIAVSDDEQPDVQPEETKPAPKKRAKKAK
jgi:hypothetical protein